MAEFVPYEPEQAQPIALGSGAFEPYEPVAETKKKAGRSLRDDLARQLGLFGRHAATIATQVGGAIADFGYGAANLAGADLKGGPPSQQFQRKLTELGLPEPETPLEKGVGFATQFIGSAMEPTMLAGQAALAARTPAGFKSPSEQTKQIAAELRQAGVKLPPSQAGGGAVARTMEGLGGSQRIADTLKFENQKVFQEMARRENNIPSTAPLTREVLDAQVKAIARDGYDPIERLSHLPVGGAMRSELRRIQQTLGTNDSFPLAQRDEVLNEVSKYMFDANGRYIREFSGRDAIAAIKSLRQESTDLFHMEGGNKALAAAKERIARAIEEQIERGLNARGASGTALLNNFKEARVQIAKNYATQKMLADPTTGNIDTAKAASAFLTGTPMTGNLRKIAQAGSPVFRESTSVPVMGQTPATTPWDDLLMTMGGAGMLGSGSPHIGGAMMAYPLARYGARKSIESNIGQKAMGSTGLFGADAAARMKIGGAGMAAPYASMFDPYNTGQ